jgi:iron complex transport system permease protein
MSSTTSRPDAQAPSRSRLVAGGLVLPALLAVAVVVSLLVGATALTSGDLGALLSARGDRTVVGILIGAAVAMSGAAMQGITRNPLADPGILGINAGASLLVVAGITWFGINSLLGYIGFALVGAALAAVAVTALATAASRGFGGSGNSPLSMALAGMVFTAGATSVASALLIADGKSLDVYRFWQVGSVAGREIGDIVPVLPLLALGFGVLLVAGRRLDILAMGDSVARGLGEKPEKLRFVIGGAAVALAAGAVAVAGPIGFVGLVAPHLLRPLIGTSYRVLLPASAFVGASLVLLADTLGRVVSPPGEVQVGIMTAVLGCPALLWVVARMRSL